MQGLGVDLRFDIASVNGQDFTFTQKISMGKIVLEESGGKGVTSKSGNQIETKFSDEQTDFIGLFDSATGNFNGSAS